MTGARLFGRPQQIPYAGVFFITEHYGNPASGLHTVQIELNRAIYMDERRRMSAASLLRCPGQRRFCGSGGCAGCHFR